MLETIIKQIKKKRKRYLTNLSKFMVGQVNWEEQQIKKRILFERIKQGKKDIFTKFKIEFANGIKGKDICFQIKRYLYEGLKQENKPNLILIEKEKRLKNENKEHIENMID